MKLLEIDPQCAEIVQEFYDNQWLDLEVRPNKYPGDRCFVMGPNLPIVVTMMFLGNVPNLITLAHEIGHGVHVALSEKQTWLNGALSSSPLILEAASIFSEQLLIDRLLQNSQDINPQSDNKEFQKVILSHQLDKLILFTSYSIMMFLWERDCYNHIKQHYKISAEELCQFWSNHQHEMYGDTVDFTPDQKWQWAIGSFPTRMFTTYRYSLSALFVLALYEKYRQEKNDFDPKYKRLLEKGGSESPIQLVQEMGFNINDPEFWQGGFDLLKALIEKLKAFYEST